jgi:hypothetical protein
MESRTRGQHHLVVIVITVDVCSLFFARRGKSYLVTLVDGMEKCERHIEWKRDSERVGFGYFNQMSFKYGGWVMIALWTIR